MQKKRGAYMVNAVKNEIRRSRSRGSRKRRKTERGPVFNQKKNDIMNRPDDMQFVHPGSNIISYT